MRTVTALDVRKRLGELLDEASAGQRIVIERDRKPLAMLVSYDEGMRLVGDDGEARERFVAALDRLDAFRERMARLHPESVGGSDAVTVIREMREERTDQIERAVREAGDHKPGKHGPGGRKADGRRRHRP